MKRIAILAALAAMLGTGFAASAAGPCACGEANSSDSAAQCGRMESPKGNQMVGKNSETTHRVKTSPWERGYRFYDN